MNSTQPVIKALVVDDSAYNRVTLSRMLESHPSIRVVATAIDGEDAIKQVMRHAPDVVTLDLEMPVMDGRAFLEAVRHAPSLADVTVVVLSGASDVRVACDTVKKPLRLDTLLGLIDRVADSVP